MIYIKLNDDLSLTITINEVIHRGDNLSHAITYLVPQTVNEIDISSAHIYLCFVCADGSSDMIMLEKSEELYNQTYYQYCLTVPCSITKYAGEVRTWLSITVNEPCEDCDCECPKMLTSGNCVLHVQETGNGGGYDYFKTLAAITQMQGEIDDIKEATTDEAIGAIVTNMLSDPDYVEALDVIIDGRAEAAIDEAASRFDPSGAAEQVRTELNAALESAVEDMDSELRDAVEALNGDLQDAVEGLNNDLQTAVNGLSNDLETAVDGLNTDLQIAVNSLSGDIQSVNNNLTSAINAIDGLPAVTASDNGKFLSVVNGSWVPVAVVDVSQEGM